MLVLVKVNCEGRDDVQLARGNAMEDVQIRILVQINRFESELSQSLTAVRICLTLTYSC